MTCDPQDIVIFFVFVWRKKSRHKVLQVINDDVWIEKTCYCHRNKNFYNPNVFSVRALSFMTCNPQDIVLFFLFFLWSRKCSHKGMQVINDDTLMEKTCYCHRNMHFYNQNVFFMSEHHCLRLINLKTPAWQYFFAVLVWKKNIIIISIA